MFTNLIAHTLRGFAIGIRRIARRPGNAALAVFLLALGIGGLTVHLAGWLFDRDGNFAMLFALFSVAAILATAAAFLLPTPTARPQPART